MPLPGKVGAMLAADMGKAGLGADEAPPGGEGGGIEEIIADIDEKVPGLGALVHELVDRLRAEDEESDAEEG